MNFKNWKTTVSAIIAVLPQVVQILWPNHVVTQNIANAISILAMALGLSQAKDHNVTGGTVANTPSDASVVKETTKKDLE